MGLTASQSAVREGLRAVLADGAWHPVAELLAAVGRLMRPEVALIYAANAHVRLEPLSLAARIELGRRRWITDQMCAMGAEGTGRGWQRRWRLPPLRPCHSCGRLFQPRIQESRHCSRSCVTATGMRTRKAKVGA